MLPFKCLLYRQAYTAAGPSEMPPRRASVGSRGAAMRRKGFVASPERQKVAKNEGGDESTDDARSRHIQESWANRSAKAIIWVTGLWRKVNGAVFAYFCFLTIFSLVVRNAQVRNFDSPPPPHALKQCATLLLAKPNRIHFGFRSARGRALRCRGVAWGANDILLLC